MIAKSLASQIYDLARAVENCERSGNKEWRAKHKESLAKLCKQMLPSGSGIDLGTKLEQVCVASERIDLSCAFHHMNEQGSYDGWTEHKVTVRPSFDGIDVKVTGPNRNEIKEYLHDVYHHALSCLVFWDESLGRWVSENEK